MPDNIKAKVQTQFGHRGFFPNYLTGNMAYGHTWIIVPTPMGFALFILR